MRVGVRVCLSRHGVWLVPRHLEILFARASRTSTGRQRRDLQAKRCYVHPVSTPALDTKKKMSRIFSLVRCTKIRPKWSHKEFLMNACLALTKSSASSALTICGAAAPQHHDNDKAATRAGLEPVWRRRRRAETQIQKMEIIQGLRLQKNVIPNEGM